MSKWTKGPWQTRDVTSMVSQTGTQTIWIGPDEWTSIASVRAGSDDDDLPAQTESNASLIAAAPDLAEALAFVETWISNPVGTYSVAALDGLFSISRERISAALAKARGE